MSARSHIRGPRFALRSTENVRACIKCVYGNGEHADWCQNKDADVLALPSAVGKEQEPDGVRALKVGEACEVSCEGRWIQGKVVSVTFREAGRELPDERLLYEARTIDGMEWGLLCIARGTIRLPQRANAETSQPPLESREEPQHKIEVGAEC